MIKTNRNIKKGIEFNVLNEKDTSEIHEASLNIMETFGVKIEGEEIIEMLKDKGAIVCENNIVKIPRYLVEDALQKAPKNIEIYNRNGETCGRIDGKRNIYFGTGADQFQYIEPETNRVRDFVRGDIEKICILVDSLPNLSFVLATGVFTGSPAEISCQQCFADVLKYFSKGIHVCTSDTNGLKDIIALAVDFVGGRAELKEKPIFIYYAEPVSPRYHPAESTLRIKLCAEFGLPIVYMPYSMMGATAPMDKASIITQNNIDVLTGLVIAQGISPGTPFIYGSMCTIMDMKTQIGSYGAPEFYLCNAAAAEVAKYYKLPFYGTGAVSDAEAMDYQSVSEIQMGLMSTMMSNSSFVHDVGEMGHSYSISPVNIVLSNEIIEQLKPFVGGVEVNKDKIIDMITKVAPAEHYLDNSDTMKHFKEIWYPELFNRSMSAKGEELIHNRVCEKIDKIFKTHKVDKLTEKKLKIIEKHEEECIKKTDFETKHPR